MLDGVLYFVFEKNKQLNNYFWKIWVVLIRADCCDLVQADLLIWLTLLAGLAGRS